MSVITVQLGQCGNQMGYHFFESLAETARAASTSTPARSYVSSSRTRENFGQDLVERFFHERLPPLGSPSSSATLHARSVLVDMESKVVDHVTDAAAAAAKLRHRRQNRGGGSSSGSCDDPSCNFNWSFNPQRIFSRKMGSGNNWANGYYNYGPQCKDEIVEMVRKEVEYCDSVDGFLLLMSLAGKRSDLRM